MKNLLGKNVWYNFYKENIRYSFYEELYHLKIYGIIFHKDFTIKGEKYGNKCSYGVD